MAPGDVQIAGVVDDVVGDAGFLFERQLRADPLKRLMARQFVAGNQPFELHGERRRDDDRAVAQRVEVGFEEQRHREHEERFA